MTGRLRAWTIACACAVAAASCVPSAASPATDVVPADSRAGQRPTPVEASAPAAGVATPRDQHAIAYALASPAERMDLYLPTTGDGPFPVVLWIHGGGWERGDRTLGPDAPSRELLSAGYAVASVDYRLSREAVFPAQILDVKAAVRYLRAHATALSVDANRIGAWGDSAGGHLVALLATSGDVRAFDDPALGSIDDSSRIQAAVDWYGPISFSTMDAQFAEDVAPNASLPRRRSRADCSARLCRPDRISCWLRVRSPM